jgi:hypothetical protein
VGLGPEGAVIDAARRRLYVTCSRSHELTVVDLDSLEPVGTIAVGREPTDVALDPERRRMFVCDLLGSTITVIDLQTGEPEQTVDVPGYPSSVVFDPTRGLVYCGCAGGSAVAVIDSDTLALLETIPAGFGAGAGLLRQLPGRHGDRDRYRAAPAAGHARGGSRALRHDDQPGYGERLPREFGVGHDHPHRPRQR